MTTVTIYTGMKLINRHTGLEMILREIVRDNGKIVDTLWDCENGESYMVRMADVIDTIGTTS